MALPSQVERTVQMSRPVMTRTSRRRTSRAGRVAIGVVLAGLAGVLVWGVIQIVPRSAKASGEGAPGVIVAKEPPDQGPARARPQTPARNNAPATGPGVSSSAVKDKDAPKPGPVDVTRRDLSPHTPDKQPPAPPSMLPPAERIGSQPAGGGTPAPSGAPGAAEVGALISAGDRLVASGKPVEARVAYSRAYLDPRATGVERGSLREKLTRINDDLVFSTKVTPGDPLTETYTVLGGDNPTKIARKRELATDHRLIMRINRIADARNIGTGQKLKLVRGPFHVVVTKSEYRADLFAGPPSEPERWLYIRSYPVGLGEKGSDTPPGEFVIKRHSKLENPPWTNPRTGEKFAANDPKNPIGEHWLGWQGVGQYETVTGFGLHGTIDPSSIGQNRSMGCVRMAAGDIAQVFEFLVEEISRVRVVE